MESPLSPLSLGSSFSPSSSIHNPLDAVFAMNTPDNETYLKMEDLHSPSTTITVSSPSQDSSPHQGAPPPVVVHSRPAKKRKSWGQALPEPKTSLPPRKRAKTDDEKEQRRIERIKRNRAAAHNSRERKRHETETLAVALARANAELEAYRRLHGPLPSSVILPEVTLSTEPAETPVPSLVESRTSIDITTPPSPAASLATYDADINIKCEPADNFSLAGDLSPAFSALDGKSVALPNFPALDQTQHSAAMLCDLQCRSSAAEAAVAALAARAATTALAMASWRTATFLSLTTLPLTHFYKTLLLALWTTSPSRMARWMELASTASASASRQARSTSPSTTSSTMPRPSVRSSTALAQRKAATAVLSVRQGALPRAQMSRHLLDFRFGTAKRTARPRPTEPARAVVMEQSRRILTGDDESDEVTLASRCCNNGSPLEKNAKQAG